MPTAIIGGGAAGLMLAIQLKTLAPSEPIVIIESNPILLSKVRLSGGGRCNLTNTFAHVDSLTAVYPRGSRQMKHLLRDFPPPSLQAWWEAHGVPLAEEEEGRLFPQSQSSQTVVEALLTTAAQSGVNIRLSTFVQTLECSNKGFQLSLQSAESTRCQTMLFDNVAVATGGTTRVEALERWVQLGHKIEMPCPSLFNLRLSDPHLKQLAGITVSPVKISLTSTKHQATGSILITHQGVSGPAVLRLSSYAARTLAEQNYQGTLLIAWCGTSDQEQTLSNLKQWCGQCASQSIGTARPFHLPSRLWQHLLLRAEMKGTQKWKEMGSKQLRKLTSLLTADAYTISGRGTHKEEFVTCGGISLRSVSSTTFESKVVPGLFFAGEILDIDGITGGYNLTAAWLTARAAAQGIARRLSTST